MFWTSPEGVALSAGSVYVTIRAIPLIQALLRPHTNGNGASVEVHLKAISQNTSDLLKEARTQSTHLELLAQAMSAHENATAKARDQVASLYYHRRKEDDP